MFKYQTASQSVAFPENRKAFNALRKSKLCIKEIQKSYSL